MMSVYIINAFFILKKNRFDPSLPGCVRCVHTGSGLAIHIVIVTSPLYLNDRIKRRGEAGGGGVRGSCGRVLVFRRYRIDP